MSLNGSAARDWRHSWSATLITPRPGFGQFASAGQRRPRRLHGRLFRAHGRVMLREEYVKLTEDLDAELVAANTMDVGQYLLGLDARGQLPRPRSPLHARVGYHQPCHLRALNVGNPGLELFRNVLELDVEFINRGCSGMGGTFGLAKDRFWLSLRAGRGLVRRLRDSDIEIGAPNAARVGFRWSKGSPNARSIPSSSSAWGMASILRAGFNFTRGSAAAARRRGPRQSRS